MRYILKAVGYTAAAALTLGVVALLVWGVTWDSRNPMGRPAAQATTSASATEAPTTDALASDQPAAVTPADTPSAADGYSLTTQQMDVLASSWSQIGPAARHNVCAEWAADPGAALAAAIIKFDSTKFSTPVLAAFFDEACQQEQP